MKDLRGEWETTGTETGRKEGGAPEEDEAMGGEGGVYLARV